MSGRRARPSIGRLVGIAGFAIVAGTALHGCRTAGGTPPAAPATSARFDPSWSAWNRVLARVASPRGIRLDAAHAARADLQQVLAEMRAVSRAEFDAWPPRAQLAFLVNAHNAAALERLARSDSPRPLDQAPWFRTPPIARRDLTFLGRRWSLRDLQNEAMSDRYRESRVVFLLHWAARGCAPLPETAATEANLPDLLERQTRRTLADERYCRFDARRNTLYLTPLVMRHRQAFERDFTTLWALVEHYGSAEVAAAVRRRLPQVRALPWDPVPAVDASSGGDSSPDQR